jgi:hypothetical protein
MSRLKTHLKTQQIFIVALILVFAGSACGLPWAIFAGVPTVPPVEIMKVVTRVVTQDVTQEATKIVDVPVTVTPASAPTLEPTSTPAVPAAVPGGLPQATLPQYTDCLYGPASFYVYKTSFPAGQQVELVGRSPDASWLNIEEVGGWNACWIMASQAQLQNERVEDLPVVSTMLPRSEYEFGSPYPSVRREGDVVTVSWEAVYMSADEIQGYLIEAEVCQGGRKVNLPVFVPLTFEENVGTISVQITDEAGCGTPSTAHIVSMGKRGFAEWEKIFWPPY